MFINNCSVSVNGSLTSEENSSQELSGRHNKAYSDTINKVITLSTTVKIYKTEYNQNQRQTEQG